jgi:glucose/arabinose dehydrogenase
MTTHDKNAASYSASLFWGTLALGGMFIGILVAILAGFLLGHYTHVRSKTIAQRTITHQVTTHPGASAAAPAATGLTAGATVNLPATGKMVSIGAGLTGAPGLSATLWGQGPKNTGDVTAGPDGSVFVSTADETGKPDDGVYLVRRGAQPVEVIKGLQATLGVVWHNDQLYVSTLGQVDVYTDFNGHSFGAKRVLLSGLPVGKLGFNDQLILGPDGRFYIGIASPTDHSPPTKPLEATIVSFNPDGSDLHIYATGVRGNSSLAFLPGTSNLFMATNQRNAVSKTSATPPDQFGLVAPGSDWGYPWCWQQGGNACRGVSHPLVNDDPHAASDGLTFIDGQWGSSYGTSAFVSEWTLGKVIRDQLTITDGVVTARPQVILTGVANAGPLMTLPNGSVLVSSYMTGKLYAIRPSGSGAAAATGATTTSASATSTTSASTTSAKAAVPAGAIPIAANPAGNLMYNTMTLTAKAGKDTFAFTNTSTVPHNFTILQGAKTIGATPTFAGGVKLLTVTLAAGKYTFECTVPGHAAAGMKGTLTVG